MLRFTRKLCFVCVYLLIVGGLFVPRLIVKYIYKYKLVVIDGTKVKWLMLGLQLVAGFVFVAI